MKNMSNDEKQFTDKTSVLIFVIVMLSVGMREDSRDKIRVKTFDPSAHTNELKI